MFRSPGTTSAMTTALSRTAQNQGSRQVHHHSIPLEKGKKQTDYVFSMHKLDKLWQHCCDSQEKELKYPPVFQQLHHYWSSILKTSKFVCFWLCLSSNINCSQSFKFWTNRREWYQTQIINTRINQISFHAPDSPTPGACMNITLDKSRCRTNEFEIYSSNTALGKLALITGSLATVKHSCASTDLGEP